MYPTTVTSPAGTITASVLAGGVALPLYRRADGRMFASAVPGSTYTLRVRNLASVRVEVIATVDGRHVLRDEPGDSRSCQGLVIPAYGTYDFRGWRINDDQSDDFVFGEPVMSVAAQATGSAENVGVIGFAAWRELLRASYPVAAAASASFDSDMTRSMSNKGAGPQSFGASSLGTGIGARKEDRVGHTSFTRAGEPDIVAIGYDTEAELARRGIIGPPDADPFPGAQTGYASFRHTS